MSEKLNLSFGDTKVKIENRSKGRMKITFKLDQKQAEAFKNFCSIKPDNIDDEAFYRHVFFCGIRAMNDELTKLYDENREQIEKMAKEEAAKQETLNVSGS